MKRWFALAISKKNCIFPWQRRKTLLSFLSHMCWKVMHCLMASQRCKIHRHTHLAPQPIPIPQRRFSHLHINLVGPLQYSNNFNYIFTIIDRTSKWMEALPLSDMFAAAWPKALPFLGFLAPSFPASCKQSSSPPPLSGSTVVAWSHLSSRSTMAPLLFCAVAPAPSPFESGHGMRSSPSAASRPARQQTLSLAAHIAGADCPVCALPQPSGSRFQTRWYLHLPLRRDGLGTVFLPGEEVFACLGPAAPPQVPQTRYLSHSVLVPSTATEVGPLTSSPSSQGQSSGGSPVDTCLHPWSMVRPVRCTPVPLYNTCLKAATYVTVNKPVLSYLLLRLLPRHKIF